MKRLTEGLAWAKRLENERGGALIEMAMCLPFLCLLVFGVIEFSRIILDCQVMNGMSRQGSDLASRGWPLADEGATPGVLTALVTQGAPLNIGTQGRIIVTEVTYDPNGNPTIADQVPSSSGITVTSRIGSGVGNAPNATLMPVNTTLAKQTVFVTEVFYSYSPFTPLGSFFSGSIGSTLYDVAYF